MVECSPISQETGVQYQVESYQRLKKRYLIPPCLTLNIIMHISRVKGNNLRKGVVPSPTLRWSSYWKGSSRVSLDYSHQLYLLLICKIFFHIRELIFLKSRAMEWSPMLRDENQRTNKNYPNYMTEISQNTEKSSGDLRKLATTWTPVKDHQLMLVWKTC